MIDGITKQYWLDELILHSVDIDTSCYNIENSVTIIIC